MKLYVLPIGSLCNARCKYCITRFRKLKNDVLIIRDLKKAFTQNTFDRIEITGGGEPSLHPEIATIVDLCADKCPTNIYTNGSYNPTDNRVQVCLSRAHYDDASNEIIMGVGYDMAKYSKCNDLKISLMLHRSGISTATELNKFLRWAQKYATKVVVRQLFEYEDNKYEDYYRSEYVSSEVLEKEIGNDYPDDLEVEFETRSCACEMNNPVLGADGIIRNGWAEL